MKLGCFGCLILIVVVLAAAVGRLGPGILAAVVSFLTFNFFFLPPYDTFIIARGEYVVALFVFLGLSVMISLLFARAIERADAAEEKEEESLKNDLQDLISTWRKIEEGAKTEKAPALLYKDMATTSGVIRDLFSNDVSRVVVDGKKLYREIRAYINYTSPQLLDKVEFHKDRMPLFDKYGIEKELEASLGLVRGAVEKQRFTSPSRRVMENSFSSLASRTSTLRPRASGLMTSATAVRFLVPAALASSSHCFNSFICASYVGRVAPHAVGAR